MRIRVLFPLFLIAFMMAAPLYAAKPPFNGPPTFDMMLYSGGDWSGEPFAADEDPWHAFFENPVMTASSPGFVYADIQDISQLSSFDMLYILQGDIDGLSPADMATVRSWMANGGSVVIGGTDEGVSAFGAFLGANYAFTGVDDPDGDNISVTNASHPLNSFPNVLGDIDLSDWGSSVHGALEDLGGAYTCISEDTDGDTTLPVMCASTFGTGTIVLMGFDPECGCHDNHLEDGDEAGSEQLENLVWYAINGAREQVPVPTLSSWALMVTALLIGLLGVGAMRRMS